MSGEIAIAVEDVSKSFGKTEALKRVSFQAMTGKVLGLLGPNGAGKTTAVRILTTLIPLDSGNATIQGINVSAHGAQIRKIIGLAGQYAAVDEYLTGRENLELVGGLYHLARKEARSRSKELLFKFDLEDAADRQVKTYSGGMRRRLDLAASLVNRPPVLFLDEPTTGLDPRSRIGLWDSIRSLVSEGMTVLLTTQYLEEADQLCDNLVVIDHGQVIANGTPDELKTSLGGDLIEFSVIKRELSQHAAEVVAKFALSAPTFESESGQITLRPVGDGTHSLANLVRALDESGIAIAGLALRRPSLDEVFLSLTGNSPDEANGN